MENKKILLTTDHAVIKTELFSVTPRLTPTGKISHAKTRVYTQRYRKEWEEMSDFKGWLTSVQGQPTRAFCTYCNKNLHAHRLSLLKHTCTMKHQRAALQHEAQQTKEPVRRKIVAREDIELEDSDDVQALENVQTEMEEHDDDDMEYVVERLDMEEDDLDDSHLKHDSVLQEEDDDDGANDDPCIRTTSDEDEDDHPRGIKKIRVSKMNSHRDTLAEAMAHVHGEYLADEDSQEGVDLEMVVENQSAPDIHMITLNQDSEDSIKELQKESQDTKTLNKLDNKIDKKPPKIYTINAIPVGKVQDKTITLRTGGKTLTLAATSFKPGAQYVLGKVKGKLPTLLVSENKSQVMATVDNTLRTTQNKNENTPAVASTSQHTSKKNVKSLFPMDKRSRVSTHVVDTSKGLPVGGMQVSLYKLMDGRWTFLNESSTNPCGRCVDLVDSSKVNFTAGRYKIHFDVDKYFTLRRVETIYPFIEIVFDVKNPVGQYHIPLLLSPFGYTTYRGSDK